VKLSCARHEGIWGEWRKSDGRGSIPGSTYLEILCTTTGSVLFQKYVFKEIQNILHLNTRSIQIKRLSIFYYIELVGESDGTTV
jgi:hypothetical protein